jgi:orotate phosphoribosyltransferase
MSLFQWGDFTLHSGEKSWWRIDCDSFTDSEIELLAKMIRHRNGAFHQVRYPESHPGSFVHKLSTALQRYKSDFVGRGFSVLVVDDVLTTGASVEEIKEQAIKEIALEGVEVWGVVIFARGKCPDWVTPIFQYVT